jgi:hypothetical protein
LPSFRYASGSGDAALASPARVAELRDAVDELGGREFDLRSDGAELFEVTFVLDADSEVDAFELGDEAMRTLAEPGLWQGASRVTRLD